MDNETVRQFIGALGAATGTGTTPEFDALDADTRAEAAESARGIVDKLGILADKIARHQDDQQP